jgi:hypothetical protein
MELELEETKGVTAQKKGKDEKSKKNSDSDYNGQNHFDKDGKDTFMNSGADEDSKLVENGGKRSDHREGDAQNVGVRTRSPGTADKDKSPGFLQRGMDAFKNKAMDMSGLRLTTVCVTLCAMYDCTICVGKEGHIYEWNEAACVCCMIILYALKKKAIYIYIYIYIYMSGMRLKTVCMTLCARMCTV